MTPLPPIVHLLALVAGAWLGLTGMDAVAPDLPSQQPPGVVEAEEQQITGPGDPSSLLQSGPFSIAMSQVRDQLGDGEEITAIHVTFDSLEVETTEDGGEGVAIDEIATSAPYLLAYSIGEARRGARGGTDVQGVEDLESVSFRATPQGGIWTARLRQGLRPPTAYEAEIPPGAVAFEVEPRPVAQ
jgi:hypothetical protein